MSDEVEKAIEAIDNFIISKKMAKGAAVEAMLTLVGTAIVLFSLSEWEDDLEKCVVYLRSVCEEGRRLKSENLNNPTKE